MAEITFLNKSHKSASIYYRINYGSVSILVRVSDHYFHKWKGDMQIVVHNPKNLSRSDIKGRAFESMVIKYNRLLSKSKSKRK